jgi:hypothetical protein
MTKIEEIKIQIELINSTFGIKLFLVKNGRNREVRTQTGHVITRGTIPQINEDLNVMFLFGILIEKHKKGDKG